MNQEQKQELESRIVVAKGIATEAEAQITERFRGQIKSTEKQSNDLVTELDLNIENQASSTIRHRFPHDGFYGEETTRTVSKNGYEWVIDPLDGTNNFVRGLPLCGFQLAILKDEKPVYSIICRPLTHERYTATRGVGAYYENTRTSEKRRLGVSDRKLSQAMAVFDSKVGKSDNPSTDVFSTIVDHIAMTRVFGVAVFDLPAIAEGSAELLVTGIAQKYDVAAGQLLIEEAGGECYGISGANAQLDDNLVIFSNKKVKTELLELLVS